MTTVAETEAVGTLTFHQALLQAEAQARSTLDVALHDRLACAVALVKAGAVFQANDHTWTVASASKSGKEYSPNGTCTCADMSFNKPRYCKHQLAMFLSQRVLTLMQQPAPPVVPQEPVPVQDDNYHVETPPLPEAPHGVDAKHIVMIQGRAFVRYAGLLELAHQKGLQELRVHWTFNSEDLSLAHAVALFPHGTFEESGDASPANCSGKVALHFRRVALTRAKARVLRDALGVDLVAVEELD